MQTDRPPAPAGKPGPPAAPARRVAPGPDNPNTYRAQAEARLRAWMQRPVTALPVILITFVALFYPFLDFWIVGPILGPQIGAVVPTLLYIVLALGLNIVVGYAGLLDLGYAAFFAIGAYVAALMTSPRSPLFTGQWTSNFWISMIFAFVAAIVAGIVLGAPTLRLRGDYLAIVTLGFGEIVPVVFRNATDLTNGEKGLAPIARPQILGYQIGAESLVINLGGIRIDLGSAAPWYYLILVLMVISFLGIRRLHDSRLGRAWVAMREDEIAASSMGINLVRTKLMAFGMGASLSGAAGAVLGSYVQFVAPSMFDFSVSVIILCMVILGGLGNMWGVILGGLLIQSFDRIVSADIGMWMSNIARSTGIGVLNNLGEFLHNSRYLVFGLTLVIMMLVRPEGLLPSGRRKAELHDTTVEQKTTGDAIHPTNQEGQETGSVYEVRDLDKPMEENR